MQFAAMLPLMVAFFMAFGVMNDPESRLRSSASLIPFTSLIVVPAARHPRRDPVDPVARRPRSSSACWATFWVAGRIYRVTVLATGQRPSLGRSGASCGAPEWSARRAEAR